MHTLMYTHAHTHTTHTQAFPSSLLTNLQLIWFAMMVQLGSTNEITLTRLTFTNITHMYNAYFVPSRMAKAQYT